MTQQDILSVGLITSGGDETEQYEALLKQHDVSIAERITSHDITPEHIGNDVLHVWLLDIDDQDWTDSLDDLLDQSHVPVFFHERGSLNKQTHPEFWVEKQIDRLYEMAGLERVKTQLEDSNLSLQEQDSDSHTDPLPEIPSQETDESVERLEKATNQLSDTLVSLAGEQGDNVSSLVEPISDIAAELKHQDEEMNDSASESSIEKTSDSDIFSEQSDDDQELEHDFSEFESKMDEFLDEHDARSKAGDFQSDTTEQVTELQDNGSFTNKSDHVHHEIEDELEEIEHEELTFGLDEDELQPASFEDEVDLDDPEFTVADDEFDFEIENSSDDNKQINDDIIESDLDEGFGEIISLDTSAEDEPSNGDNWQDEQRQQDDLNDLSFEFDADDADMSEISSDQIEYSSDEGSFENDSLDNGSFDNDSFDNDISLEMVESLDDQSLEQEFSDTELSSDLVSEENLEFDFSSEESDEDNVTAKDESLLSNLFEESESAGDSFSKSDEYEVDDSASSTPEAVDDVTESLEWDLESERDDTVAQEDFNEHQKSIESTAELDDAIDFSDSVEQVDNTEEDALPFEGELSAEKSTFHDQDLEDATEKTELSDSDELSAPKQHFESTDPAELPDDDLADLTLDFIETETKLSSSEQTESEDQSDEYKEQIDSDPVDQDLEIADQEEGEDEDISLMEGALDEDALDDALNDIPLLDETAGAMQFEEIFDEEDAEEVEESSQLLWVLGASLGGPAAVKRFLQALKGDVNTAFVLAQHIDENFLPVLCNILDTQTAFNAKIVDRKMLIEDGNIYIAPISNQIQFNSDQTVEPIDSPWTRPYAPCIDDVISAAGQVYKKRCGVVIFSGMGSDGVKGLEQSQSLGLTVWTQSAESCANSSMPDSVNDARLSVYTGDPEELAAELYEHVASQMEALS